MTDFSDLKSQIRDWANRQDWSDALTTSYVRMAEQKFNAELRVDRMIKSAAGIMTDRCGMLPDDWLHMHFVQIESASSANGMWPMEYMSKDEFFKSTDKQTSGWYTIKGRRIFFGGAAADEIEGTTFQIDYYGEVPVLTDTTSSFIYTKYPTLYLFGSLMHADLHAVGEEDKAIGLKQEVETQIQKLNAGHQLAQSSGSRVRRIRARGFG